VVIMAFVNNQISGKETWIWSNWLQIQKDFDPFRNWSLYQIEQTLLKCVQMYNSTLDQLEQMATQQTTPLIHKILNSYGEMNFEDLRNKLEFKKHRGSIADASIFMNISMNDIQVLDVLGKGTSSIVSKVNYQKKIIVMKEMIGLTNYQSLDEMLIMGQIPPHENVITFMGYNATSLSKICIFTEYLDGGQLDNYIIKHQAANDWKMRHILWIMHQIAKGISHLHYYDVTHRDLHIRNILCQQTDNIFFPKIKIMDFGSRLDPSLNSTKVPWLITPPEAGRKVDGRVIYSKNYDIFSFGIVFHFLWALFNKRGIFFDSPEVKPLHMVSTDIKENDIKKITELLATGWKPKSSSIWTNEFAGLIEACFSQLPEERPTSDQVVDAIEKILTSFMM